MCIRPWSLCKSVCSRGIDCATSVSWGPDNTLRKKSHEPKRTRDLGDARHELLRITYTSEIFATSCWRTRSRHHVVNADEICVYVLLELAKRRRPKSYERERRIPFKTSGRKRDSVGVGVEACKVAVQIGVMKKNARHTGLLTREGLQGGLPAEAWGYISSKGHKKHHVVDTTCCKYKYMQILHVVKTRLAFLRKAKRVMNDI